MAFFFGEMILKEVIYRIYAKNIVIELNIKYSICDIGLGKLERLSQIPALARVHCADSFISKVRKRWLIQ